MVSKYYKERLACLIGNLLEHYDTALFGLIAPFISPYFFGQNDPITGLILTYAILPISLITKPLGALFFGYLGDLYGRRVALFYSLLGMSLASVSIGFLPGYTSVGFWSPIMLALLKLSQNFFAAGESSGGAIFVLEHTPERNREVMSGLYGASSIGGILIASGAIAAMCFFDCIKTHWHLLFWAASSTAFFAIFLGFLSEESPEFKKGGYLNLSSYFQEIYEHRSILFSITLASGFSHVTYSLSFTLMNGLIPLVTDLSTAQVMSSNTLLLFCDMILLPFFGYLAHQWGNNKVMLAGVLGSIITAIPLFYLLKGASLEMVFFVRLSLITFGVAFAATYHAWAVAKTLQKSRYLILSLGSALGAQLIGSPCSALSLLLYKKLNWVGAPGLYLIASGLAAWYVLEKSHHASLEQIKSSS